MGGRQKARRATLAPPKNRFGKCECPYRFSITRVVQHSEDARCHSGSPTSSFPLPYVVIPAQAGRWIHV